MEIKTSNLIKKISLMIFTIIINMAMAQKSEIPVRVGVVLDMDHYLGQMGFNCITMALSEFYGTHSYYKTRLVLNIRDSKRDVVGAAAAALDLLKNEEVEAVIGPLSSAQADFLINLGDKAHVPVITFSATNPSLSSIGSPYFIRAALNDSSQVSAICSILQAFGWRQVVAIYEDTEFGKGIVPFLTDSLEQVNVRVPFKSAISPFATDDRIVLELYKLMTMSTRVFVVHVRPRLGARLFAKAKALGMMTGDYAWIVTDGMTNELKSIDPHVMESMLGVIGVQPYIPKTKQLGSFKNRYRKRFGLNLNIFGLWAYDSAVALAMAVEKSMITNNSFLKTNAARNSTELEGFGVSSAGTKLIQALSTIVFRGLVGDFELVDGQLQSPPYQIINVVGRGARVVVGYWTKEKGIVRELSFTGANTTHSTSKSKIRSIIWPGDKTSPPKGWVIPTNGNKLRVGVPINDVFRTFVQYTWDNHTNSTQVGGYCLDVFDAVIGALPYGVQYEYVPFAIDHESAGTYNDLVYQVYSKEYDAVVGDVTIRANRSQYVDFTLPFTESGVSMVVPIKYVKRKRPWVFLTPLTWQLWLTTFFSFIFIGFLIWILEHRVNEDFRGPFWHQVGTIFWFSFSTMVFTQKERVTSNLARFVMIIWFLVVLILTQSYTASLASMLTVQRHQPTFTDVKELIRNKESVAYLDGSFVLGLLKDMGIQESQLKPYSSSEELDELLTNGSKNGGVAAVFDEIPYMKLFLADKRCSKYTMAGPTYKTAGFGFAFPIGSPLVNDISRAILNVTESNKMVAIEKTWLGNEIECSDSSTLSSDNIGLESLWGLFLIVIIAAVLAFVIFVVKFMRENWHVMDHSHPGSTIGSKVVELLRRFNNKDFNSHTFKRAIKPSSPHSNGTEKFVASEISENRTSSFQHPKSRVMPIETRLQAYQQEETESSGRSMRRDREGIELEEQQHVEQPKFQ